MATTLRLFGKLTYWDEVSKKVYPFRGSAINATSEKDTEDILYFPDGDAGTLTILETVENSETWTLTGTTGSVQELSLEWIFGEQWNTDPGSMTVIEHLSGTVPAAPHEITVTGATADQEAYLVLTSTAAGGGGDKPMTRVATATGADATGEFDVSSDTITFDSSDEGKTYSGIIKLTKTPAKAMGGTLASNPVGTLSFYGVMRPSTSPVSSTINTWWGSLSSSDGVEFASDGDSVELALTAATPTTWTKPYLHWIMPA